MSLSGNLALRLAFPVGQDSNKYVEELLCKCANVKSTFAFLGGLIYFYALMMPISFLQFGYNFWHELLMFMVFFFSWGFALLARFLVFACVNAME